MARQSLLDSDFCYVENYIRGAKVTGLVDTNYVKEKIQMDLNFSENQRYQREFKVYFLRMQLRPYRLQWMGKIYMESRICIIDEGHIGS